MISEAMPTFLDKDLLMDVQYQKVTEKAKDYEFEMVSNLSKKKLCLDTSAEFIYDWAT